LTTGWWSPGFATYPYSALPSLSKGLLSRAAARASSSETMSIEFPDRGLARGKGSRGELCLYVAKTQGRLSMFWLACRCILGLVKQQRDLRIFKGATADISARRSRLLVAFDGEVATMRSPLHFKIRPRALRVFAPPIGSAHDSARAQPIKQMPSCPTCKGTGKKPS